MSLSIVFEVEAVSDRSMLLGQNS